MAKSTDRADSIAAAVNNFLTGKRPTPSQDPRPVEPPAPPPEWLDPATARRMARLWRAVRIWQAERQANDPTVIGQEFLARRAVGTEFFERIEREGWDAVVNPPAPTLNLSFTELAFLAWLAGLLRRGLADADSLLLGWFVCARLPWPGQGGAVVGFLDVLADIDPQPEAVTDLTDLYMLLAQPAPAPRRGPKGRHKSAAAVDQAAARELFAKRQAEGRLTIPNIDPWHVVQNLADVIDGIIAGDKGRRVARGTTSQRDPLADDSSLRQAWYGNRKRRLPSLRRWLVIKALAEHCLTWWLDEYSREAVQTPHREP